MYRSSFFADAINPMPDVWNLPVDYCPCRETSTNSRVPVCRPTAVFTLILHLGCAVVFLNVGLQTFFFVCCFVSFLASASFVFPMQQPVEWRLSVCWFCTCCMAVCAACRFGLKTTFIDEGTFKARVLADDEEFPVPDAVDFSSIPVPVSKSQNL